MNKQLIWDYFQYEGDKAFIGSIGRLRFLVNHAQTLISSSKNIERFMAKDGYLIGTVPFNENLLANQVFCTNCGHLFHKWGHHQSFDVKRLNSILSLNFKVETIEVIYFVSCLSFNLKGKLVSGVKKLLSIFGEHGSNENIFFTVRKFL